MEFRLEIVLKKSFGMKSFKELEKEYTPKEMAESLVFPDTRNTEERDNALVELRQFRKKVADNQTEKNRVISKLLQLKFLMEDYLRVDMFQNNLSFGYFLREYIQRLEKKNKEFAAEIDIDPTELSQVINKRRNPTEKLVFRLEIHSNRNFPAILWLKLMEKDRMYEILHNKGIIDKERKHVKHKLAFTF